MSSKLYIQILYPCEIYDVSYVARQQFEFVGTELRTIDHKDNPNNASAWYNIGLDCDGNVLYIPYEYSVVTDQCISEVNLQRYIQKRDMDKTNDYYAKVKEVLDIDMKLNHRIQYDKRFYDKLYLKTPGDTQETISENTGGE